MRRYCWKWNKILQDNFITNKIVISNHGNFLSLFLLLIFRSNFQEINFKERTFWLLTTSFNYSHGSKLLKDIWYLNHQNIKYLKSIILDMIAHILSHSAHFQDKDFCMSCGTYKKNNMRFNKYFSNSYLKSFFVILYGKRYIEILKNIKTNLIVLTEFHKRYLIRKYSLEANKISVFPNFISDDTKNNLKELDEDYGLRWKNFEWKKRWWIMFFLNADIENLLYILLEMVHKKSLLIKSMKIIKLNSLDIKIIKTL